MNTNQKRKIIVVIGPTASGKSDFAVELALKGNGEIISADSRQVFKGLDLGTGKITKEEMKNVKHHMLDVYDVGEEVSVARFARDASPIIEEIFSRRKTPIICGGTGQYIDALIFNQEIPKVKPNKKLREELNKRSTEELYEELSKKDLRRANEIDKYNRPRLIRALEIIESLGSVPPQVRPVLKFKTEIYLLNPDRKILRERIEKRFDKRIALGMIDEVKNLTMPAQAGVKGYTSDQMKKFGLEYKYIGEFLEGKILGAKSDEDVYRQQSENVKQLREKIVTKSMQYAKRQSTWNKKYEKIAKII